jgi:hypothetical protein
MNRKKIVVLSGGLGNQLFQFCFAHVLAAHHSGTVSIYSLKPKDEARNFVLNSLCYNCSQIKKVILRRSWIIDLGFKCRDFFHFRFDYLFHRISNKFSMLRRMLMPMAILFFLKYSTQDIFNIGDLSKRDYHSFILS